MTNDAPPNTPNAPPPLVWRRGVRSPRQSWAPRRGPGYSSTGLARQAQSRHSSSAIRYSTGVPSASRCTTLPLTSSLRLPQDSHGGGTYWTNSAAVNARPPSIPPIFTGAGEEKPHRVHVTDGASSALRLGLARRHPVRECVPDCLGSTWRLRAIQYIGLDLARHLPARGIAAVDQPIGTQAATRPLRPSPQPSRGPHRSERRSSIGSSARSG